MIFSHLFPVLIPFSGPNHPGRIQTWNLTTRVDWYPVEDCKCVMLNQWPQSASQKISMTGNLLLNHDYRVYCPTNLMQLERKAANVSTQRLSSETLKRLRVDTSYDLNCNNMRNNMMQFLM